MSIGRNQPCPCGSGRKYKHCCLASVPRSGEDDIVAMHHALNELELDILHRGPKMADEAAQAAAEDFRRGDETIDLGGPERQAFIPWLLYVWRGGTGWPTLAEKYLDRHARRLPERELRYLRDSLEEPFSFYEVVGTTPDRVMLRDVLRQHDVEIVDREGARTLNRGDVLFAKVMTVEGTALMTGNGGFRIPPIFKGPIIEFRRALQEAHGSVTTEILKEDPRLVWDSYFDVRQELLHPQRPQLTNTDGDPMELHTLTYRIHSAEEVFEVLRSLAKGVSRKDLLDGARFAADGRLESVELPWLKRGNRLHGSWENTVLGHLAIEGEELTIEVNSAKRARRIRKLVDRRLGELGSYRSTYSRSFEEERAHGGLEGEAAATAASLTDMEELAATPEVQELMLRQLEQHLETWPDCPLPALGGRTPAEAVLDPDGREMVEALITQFERDRMAQGDLTGASEVFARLRRQLGIA